MLRVERDGNQSFVRINSSSLSILQTCPRKSQYLLKEKLKGKSGSPPLIFGNAIHKALEVFYKQPHSERTPIPRDFEEIAQTIAHGYEPPFQHFLFDAVKAFVAAADPLRMLPDTDKRSLSSGIWTLCKYFGIYINDQYVTFQDEAGPVTERKFTTTIVDTPTLKIELFGTIDFILQNLATKELLPGDHKTSSQMGNDFLNRIKPNHQYTGYVVGVQRVLGLDTEKFLVNGIQVKPKPLTARGGPPHFTRQITTRTSEDIAEFIAVVQGAVENYLRWESANVWPLGNVDSCAMWAGCQFLEVCSAPNALRQNILSAKYEPAK